MTIQIEKGRQKSPYRIVLYGLPGMLKSSFMSCAPDPLFIDPNKNTVRLNVNRVNVDSALDVSDVLRAVESGAIKRKTLVVEEFWAMEKLIQDDILNAAGVKQLRKVGGYGDGYVEARRRARDWLDFLERISDRGVNVAIIGHADVKKFENPEGSDYNHYIFACDKRVWPEIFRWAEAVLFFSQEAKAVEKDEKVIAVAMEPKIFAQGSAAYAAKNRFNMPKSMKLTSPKETYTKFQAYVDATNNIDELKKAYPEIQDDYILVQTAVVDKFKESK